MSKKIKAFTLAEILIVISIIGVIAVLCLSSFFGSDGFYKKKLKVLSRDFYTVVNNVYPAILSNETIGYDITKFKSLESVSSPEKEDLSEAMRDNFVKYIGTEPEDCSILPVVIGYDLKKEDYFCFSTQQGVIAGVSLFPSQTTYLRGLEFYRDSTSGGTAAAYGHVLYTIKGVGAGTIGKDVFMIGLGKTRVE